MTRKEILPLSFEAILIFLIIFSPIFYGSLTPMALAVSQFTKLLLFALFITKLNKLMLSIFELGKVKRIL